MRIPERVSLSILLNEGWELINDECVRADALLCVPKGHTCLAIDEDGVWNTLVCSPVRGVSMASIIELAKQNVLAKEGNCPTCYHGYLTGSTIRREVRRIIEELQDLDPDEAMARMVLEVII